MRAQLDDLPFLRDYRESSRSAPKTRRDRAGWPHRPLKRVGATVETDRVRRESRSGCATSARRRARARSARSEAGRRYLAAAIQLSRKRHTAARDLEKKVQGELALLAMERTRFQVAFSPDSPTGSADDTSAWTDRGLETAEFLLSPNPGEDLRPLARIASGGELSRILLALKSVANLDARGKTLVFDEVDAGIGGRVAEVVGRKLRDMSRHHQVLCVTHLPQIASMADRHLVVRKQVERGRTTTEVGVLDASERVEEVARMLGGETIPDAARRHAREMVKQARA